MNYVAEARRAVSSIVRPMIKSAAKNYIAGDTILEAIEAAMGLAERGLPTTLGYWDAPGESPNDVLSRYIDVLAALAPSPLDSYLSIKLPSLDYCERRVTEVVESAAAISRRVHFDALDVDSVDRTWAILAALHEHHDHLRCTLPGRWQRSVADADWVVAQRLPCAWSKVSLPTPPIPHGTVVVGTWKWSTRWPVGLDMCRLPRTKPRALIEACLTRLTRAGTPCDVEVLFGLGWHGALGVAKRFGVPVRVYVPYGAAYLPYCLAEARRSPRLLCRVMIDAVKASLWSAMQD